eukprot:PhF_6_TR32885/c0_g1_i1/m.48373
MRKIPRDCIDHMLRPANNIQRYNAVDRYVCLADIFFQSPPRPKIRPQNCLDDFEYARHLPLLLPGKDNGKEKGTTMGSKTQLQQTPPPGGGLSSSSTTSALKEITRNRASHPTSTPSP